MFDSNCSYDVSSWSGSHYSEVWRHHVRKIGKWRANWEVIVVFNNRLEWYLKHINNFIMNMNVLYIMTVSHGCNTTQGEDAGSVPPRSRYNWSATPNGTKQYAYRFPILHVKTSFLRLFLIELVSEGDRYLNLSIYNSLPFVSFATTQKRRDQFE